MKSKSIFFLAVILSLLSFSACNSHGEKQPQKQSSVFSKKEVVKKSKITVGLSIDTLVMERWQRDLDFFVNKVHELGGEVIVQNAGNNLNEQKKQILYLAEKNVDVMVVIPKSAEELAETIQKIKSKGIPVISYDRLLLNCDVDLYVSINCEEVGQLMGKGMLKSTNKKNWYCMLGSQDDYNISLIQKGLYSAIAGSGVKISGVFYTDGWNYDLSYRQMEKLISTNNIPEVLICGNDAITVSVLQALDEYGHKRHIPICGQDADIAACQNILKGTQDFTIYKPISQLAEKAAILSVSLARLKSTEDMNYTFSTIKNGYKDVPVYWISPTLVDKDNMEDVIINSGYHSKSEIYGK